MMSPGLLIRRSLIYYWRSSLATLCGAALAAAILIGALAVGDTIRYSLRKSAEARVGKAQLLHFSPERFFHASLADGLSSSLGVTAAPVAMMRGTVEGNPKQENAASLRVGEAQIIGCDARFWQFSPAPPTENSSATGARINKYLADRLNIKAGDDLTISVVKPSLLSRDAPLSTLEDATLSLRITVDAVISDDEYGRFGLTASPLPPLTVFLPLEILQQRIGQAGRANMLLVGGNDKTITPAAATEALWKEWQLSDSGFTVKEVFSKSSAELRTERIFLDASQTDLRRQVVPCRLAHADLFREFHRDWREGHSILDRRRIASNVDRFNSVR